MKGCVSYNMCENELVEFFVVFETFLYILQNYYSGDSSTAIFTNSKILLIIFVFVEI